MMEELKSSLRLITNPKDAKPGELIRELKLLDEILNQNASQLDPRLRHFLQNRSYEKALIWLKGEEPEKGVCGK
ncbi:MAG TPA: hypothetical protein DCW45_02440 [Opitutae bacterium]|nr:hypothetical protein [Opitutae bacterium]